MILRILILIYILAALCTNYSLAEEQVNWQIISSGGSCFGQTGNIQIGSTAGQTATGSGEAGNITIYHGFWTFYCCFVPGDANGDGSCNIGDAVFLNNLIFHSGSLPDCYAEGNVNGDENVNIGDAVYITNYVFKEQQCDDPPGNIIGCPPKCGRE